MKSIGTLQIFDRCSIDALAWGNTAYNDYALRYLLPYLEYGPGHFIDNAHKTKIMIVRVGSLLLPITRTEYHPSNTYTVSPYSHYIAYGAFEEAHKLNNALLEAVIRGIMTPFAWYLKQTLFDHVVYVNNWLLSTNLYPQNYDSLEMAAIARSLPAHFPEHAIVFRSVDPYRNKKLLDLLSAEGYHMVLSRQVYYQKPEVTKSKKQHKVDLSRLRRTEYEIVRGEEITTDDIPRIVELYRMLYLDKYSYYNPQFNAAFLKHVLDNKLLQLIGMRKNGRLDGVIGYFVRDGVSTAPLLGYDTTLPQNLRLYSHLVTLMRQDNIEHNHLIHASAGVGSFKRLRGGEPVFEYNAVYNQHLPPGRRIPWQMLKLLLDYIGKPVFQRYGF